MTVLLIGGNGQLGLCLQRELKHSKYPYVVKSSEELNITDSNAINICVQEISPTAIINASAFTNVDQCEISKDLAMNVNKDGTKNLAKVCKDKNIPLIHISTDYVFDGISSKPYLPEDSVNPATIYGMSKLAGEVEILDHCKTYMIIRTSWLFSEFGKNFLKTILKLGQEREYIEVVADQIGTPTYAGDLAKVILVALPFLSENKNASGIYHYAGDHPCSWYEFATSILDSALAVGYVLEAPTIKPVATSSYPTLAPRPSYSALDSSKFCNLLNVNPSNWKARLENVIINSMTN